VSDLKRLSTSELVEMCSQGQSQAAWEEFVRRFHPVIASVVMRRARHWGETRLDVIGELVQDVYLKLCAEGGRLLLEFEPAHPEAFSGYLKVMTAHLVSDYFKAANTGKRGGRSAAVSIEEAERLSRTGSQTLSAGERDLLLKELDVLLREATQGKTAERDRMIFWLHYHNGMTAAAIAALPALKMNVKSVESVIHRLTRALRAEVGAVKKIGNE
jgi:RNA polymerase sigma-70 factor (ECF subfamily)